jgi:hypothetical protein
MCNRPATASTAIVDGESFAVCRSHLRLWQRTPEDISLRDWCRRITMPVSQSREMGRSVFCDWMDEMAVGS